MGLGVSLVVKSAHLNSGDLGFESRWRFVICSKAKILKPPLFNQKKKKKRVHIIRGTPFLRYSSNFTYEITNFSFQELKLKPNNQKKGSNRKSNRKYKHNGYLDQNKHYEFPALTNPFAIFILHHHHHSYVAKHTSFNEPPFIQALELPRPVSSIEIFKLSGHWDCQNGPNEVPARSIGPFQATSVSYACTLPHLR